MQSPSDEEPSSRAAFRLLDVWIEPELDRLNRNGVTIHLELKLTEVLLFLAQHPQHVVSKDQILEAVWPNQFVAESTLSRAIAELRRALGDDAHSPRFIETIPRRGYRLIAPVERPAAPASTVSGTSAAPETVRASRRFAYLAAVILLVGAAVLAVAFRFRTAAVSVGAEPGIRVIAVAPLKNLSGDPEQDYIAEAMTEMLIGDLARIRSLRVISRTSVQYYLDSGKPLPEIARALKLDGLVAGSVIREGGRLRVLATLVSPESERYTWSQSYDRDFSALLELQSEIAHTITQEIRAQVTPEEVELLAVREAVDPEARDLTLRANHFLRGHGAEAAAVEQARQYYQRALDIQPDYVEALTGLADVHIKRNWISTELEPTGDAAQAEAELAAAETAALKALAHDPGHAEALVILGDVAESRRDWEAAKKYNRAALDAAPNSAGVNINYGHVLSLPLAEKLVYYRRAVELDPVSRNANLRLQFHYWQMERFDEARSQGERTVSLYPDYRPATFYLGLTLIEQGRIDEGLALIRGLDWSTSPIAKLARGPVALALALAGERDEARATVEAVEKDVPDGNNADVYAQLGDFDRAIAELEQAARGGADVEYMAWDRLLDPLRDDPRFRDLLRRFDLPEIEEITTRAHRPRNPPPGRSLR